MRSEKTTNSIESRKNISKHFYCYFIINFCRMVCFGPSISFINIKYSIFGGFYSCFSTSNIYHSFCLIFIFFLRIIRCDYKECMALSFIICHLRSIRYWIKFMWSTWYSILRWHSLAWHSNCFVFLFKSFFFILLFLRPLFIWQMCNEMVSLLGSPLLQVHNNAASCCAMPCCVLCVLYD